MSMGSSILAGARMEAAEKIGKKKKKEEKKTAAS